MKERIASGVGRNGVSWVLAAACAAALGCGTADAPRVGYGPAQQTWVAGPTGVGASAGVSGGYLPPGGGQTAGVGGSTFPPPTAGVSGNGFPPVGGSGGTAGDPGFGGTGGVAGDPGFGGSGGVAGGTAGVGAAGVGGAGTGGTAGTGGGPGSGYNAMTFDVLTHPQGGRFAPNNVGAIWIENSSGQFVKTLEAWAFIRAGYLTKFSAEAGADRTDAVSSATLPSHKNHHNTWNLKDSKGNPAPNGAYKIIVELTDADATGQFVSVDFTLGAGAPPVMPPDAQFFTGMSIAFQ